MVFPGATQQPLTRQRVELIEGHMGLGGAVVDGGRALKQALFWVVGSILLGQ